MRSNTKVILGILIVVIVGVGAYFIGKSGTIGTASVYNATITKAAPSAVATKTTPSASTTDPLWCLRNGGTVGSDGLCYGNPSIITNVSAVTGPSDDVATQPNGPRCVKIYWTCGSEGSGDCVATICSPAVIQNIVVPSNLMVAAVKPLEASAASSSK